MHHAPDTHGISRLHQPGRALLVYGAQRAPVISPLVAVAKERRRVKENLRAAQRPGEPANVRHVARHDPDIFDTVWCLLSVEFQIRAAREPAFREVFAELSRIDRTKVARFIEALFRRAGTRLPAKAGHLAAAFMALIQGLTLRRAADPRSLPPGATGELVSLLQRALLSGKFS